jgi:hypothetical protein
MHPIIGLSVGPRGRKGPIPRIGHDLEYPLRYLLSFGSKRPQPRMRSFFHGVDAKGINGAFHVSTTILHFVVASAAKAELGALSHNCQTGIIFQLTLTEMGHPQPKPPVHCNNATAVGIANNTIKRQCSQSMEMRFFWIGDKIAQQMYNLKWHPGQDNLADYQSKHHIGLHPTAVQPWCLHLENSPRV